MSEVFYGLITGMFLLSTLLIASKSHTMAMLVVSMGLVIPVFMINLFILLGTIVINFNW